LNCHFRDSLAELRIRVAVDLQNNFIETIHPEIAGGRRTYKIFDVNDQWVRGADGDGRIALDRQSGLVIVGNVGQNESAISGQCQRASERLF